MSTVASPPPTVAPAARVPLPPGPKAPMPLQSLAFWQRHVTTVDHMAKKYGDVYTIRIMPWGTCVVLGDPALVKEVMAGPADTFLAGKSNGEMFHPILGHRGILTTDGDEHLATRKRLLPSFHGKAIANYERDVRELTAARVADWKPGVPVRMHDESRAMTLEVIIRAVFGAGDSPLLPELRRRLGQITHITAPITLWYVRPELALLPPWRQYAHAIERTNVLIDQLIDERRAAPDLEQREDILSLLIRGGDDDHAWLRDQVINLLAAGHETTTTGLAWAVELLAHHPAARARAREDDDAYLDAVITETLRIRTVLPSGFTRTLAKPVRIGPYDFPAGITLLGNNVAMHRDARIYPDPLAFRPERWLDERPGTYSWLPFGGGRRRCIGAAFAQMEMRVALRTILDACDVAPARKRPDRQKNFHISLVPARGARIVRS